MIGGNLLYSLPSAAIAIDRKATVSRHDPIMKKIDPLSPLSLGNGEFTFTSDFTGLQTFPDIYDKSMPLCTMSQWGWHTFPSNLDSNTLRLTPFDTHGRSVGYPVDSEGQKELFSYLRENPHRLHLGRLGLKLTLPNGTEATTNDITDIDQRLDLWNGILYSRFKVAGSPVRVRTCVHPKVDQIAVMIESPLIESDNLAVRISFPYGSSNMNAADWNKPDKHLSKISTINKDTIRIDRKLDSDEYFVTIFCSNVKYTNEDEHTLLLKARGRIFEFTTAFANAQMEQQLPNIEDTFLASSNYWNKFWSTGGAVDLSASIDPRAKELERRIVLSQYLTAIQCTGSLPPQETGLTVNSWYGKFHLEMHWWHTAHFALWRRTQLFEKSLDWYSKILPSAKEKAASQGYTGARWPKMVGPEGHDSPSTIGPLLIWQQPHPIFYAELCLRAHNHIGTLERFADIVFESAEFMASYAWLNQSRKRYELGPPLIPAQENHPPRETWNPTFELEYWRFGLDIAQKWRERLGLKRDRKWDEVIKKLSLPTIVDGVYMAHENCPETFTKKNIDHPSMLAAFGMLPGKLIDKKVMQSTLNKVLKEWQWNQTWGWDFPMTAMTAARLGHMDVAIDTLLMDAEKNKYLPNGHNYQRPNLPCYLPANGGLLYAIAMMTAGADGMPKEPTFPEKWNVKWEAIDPAP